MRRRSRPPLVLVALAALAAPAPCRRLAIAAKQQTLALDVCGGAWSARSAGAWLDRPDGRGLRGMLHPWAPSQSDGYAELVRDVTVPASWSGPVVLAFYVSDDYVATGYRKDEGATFVGADLFVGHRRKRVLVDGRIVWERDVADGYDEPEEVRIDLSSRVRPGQRFRLALRVDDTVSSRDALPGDDHMGWTWDPAEVAHREHANRSPEIDARFETRVYWGDVGLVTDPGAGPNPFEPTLPVARLAPSPPSTALAAPRTVVLPLEAPAALPAGGYPSTSGVPFAQGQLRDERQVLLLGPDGAERPLQTRVLARWPDGSVKWLLLDFIARAPGSYTLRFGPGIARGAVEPHPVRVDERAPSGGVVLHAGGALDVPLDREAHLLPAGADLSLVESGRRYALRGESLEVLDRGPIRASVRVSGRIVDGLAVLGRFSARIEAWAGMPFTRVVLRTFNGTRRTLHVERLDLRVPAPGGAAALASADFGLGDRRPVPTTLEQTGYRRLTIDGRPLAGEAPGWVAAGDAGGSVELVAVRRLAKESPRALAVEPAGIVARLFDPTPDEPAFAPTSGEAKTHDLMIGHVVDGEAPRIAESFLRPPRLFSKEYLAETGALGPLALHDDRHFPGFDAAARAFRARELEDDRRGHGIRDYPDVYSGAATGAFVHSWLDFYHDAIHAIALEYAMTGDRALFDLAEAATVHFMDVDTLHDGSRLDGLPHGCGPNHTGSPPYSLNSTLDGLVDIHFLTGDPDAWDAALAVGEGIVRNHFGFGSGGSARDTGWPMHAVGRLYRETRDPKWRDYLHRLVMNAVAHTDMRRGVYRETHGSLSYRGSVPFMIGVLGHGLMHAVSDAGDPDAAALLVRLARGLVAEAVVEPGLFHYSPNPHIDVPSSYYDFIYAPLFLFAHRLSGDPALHDAGLAAFERGCADRQLSSITGFDAAEMLWLVRAETGEGAAPSAAISP